MRVKLGTAFQQMTEDHSSLNRALVALSACYYKRDTAAVNELKTAVYTTSSFNRLCIPKHLSSFA